MEEKIVRKDQELIQETGFPSDLPLYTDDLKELYAALAKAQSEMRIAGLTSENPYFKSRYADLAELKRASTQALTKYGLSVTFQIIANDIGQTMLYCTMAHATGQFIRSRMRIVPLKNDPQSFGSVMTYLKRYMYAAMTGVVASDEDDDGERAMTDIRRDFSKGVSLNPKPDPRQSSDTITREQLEELEYELAEYSDITEKVLDGLAIDTLADMPKAKFLTSINRIRDIKAARNGK